MNKPHPKRLKRAEVPLTEYQERRLLRWLPSRQKHVKSLWTGKSKSRKQAIQYQCLDCCGEDVSAVRTCSDICCPLWHFRPFQSKPVDTPEPD